jgi:hypothetical protein
LVLCSLIGLLGRLRRPTHIDGLHNVTHNGDQVVRTSLKPRIATKASHSGAASPRHSRARTSLDLPARATSPPAYSNPPPTATSLPSSRARRIWRRVSIGRSLSQSHHSTVPVSACLLTSGQALAGEAPRVSLLLAWFRVRPATAPAIGRPAHTFLLCGRTMKQRMNMGASPLWSSGPDDDFT